MAQQKKTSKKSQSSKTSSSKAKTGKTAPKKNAAKERETVNRNPLYVLIILSLITVIVVLLNNFTMKPEKKVDPADDRDLIKTEELQKKEVIDEEPDESETAENGTKEAAAIKEKSVKLYFIRLNENNEKFYLSTVRRNVDESRYFSETMNKLIQGPSGYEKKMGYLSAVPGDLRIRNIRLNNRTAFIDFNSAIEHDATGNILINRLDQIVYTATQFPEVDSVVVTINGRARDSLGSDGLSISGPLHRR